MKGDDLTAEVGASTTRRSASRSRRLVEGVGSGIISRGVAVIGPLILVPITLTYFGEVRFGLVAAITALFAAAVFSDFGLGSGLLTQLTIAVAEGDKNLVRDLTATCVVILMILCSLLGGGLALFLAAGAATSLVGDKGAEGISSNEVTAVLGILGAAFLFNIPCSLVHRVELAYQMVVASNVWQGIGAIVSVAATLAAIELDVGFIGVVAAAAFTLPVVNLLNWFWLIASAQRESALWRGRVKRDLVRPLLGIGSSFFLLTALLAISSNLDQFLVARVAGLDASASLSIASRMLFIFGILNLALTMTFWPLAGEAIRAHDYRWVLTALRRAALLSVVASIVVISSVTAAAPWLVDLLVPAGSSVKVSLWLIVGEGMWMAVIIMFAPLLAVLNAQGKLAVQVISLLAFLALSTPLKIAFSNDLSFVAIPYVGAIAYVICLAPLAIRSLRSLKTPTLIRREVLGAEGT